MVNVKPKSFKLPQKYQNNPSIMNDRAWKLLEYIKDNAYPSLSFRDFWNLFGLSERYHIDVVKHIHNSISKGTQFTFSEKSRSSIRIVIQTDISISVVVKNYILNEISYFDSISSSGVNQYSGALFHPLQSSLIQIFSTHMGRGNNPFNNREMTRFIYGPQSTHDLFSRQFSRIVRGVIRQEPSRYGINSLIYHISESLTIPNVVKILAVAEIELYGIASGITLDRTFNKEYDLYRSLSYIFTKDRPDLLPKGQKIFTLEALSKLIMGTSRRYDKNLLSIAINTNDPIFAPGVARVHSKVRRLINDPNLRAFGLAEITQYASYVAKIVHNKLTPNQPYAHKRGLYGFGWFSQRLRATRKINLMRESFNLDGLTGNFVFNGVPHHIEYDKSKIDDRFLIWVEAFTNYQIIRDPPRQQYFGQPIDFSTSAGAMEDMITLRAAKDAFGHGRHAPHWADKSHRFYYPEGIRRFYWFKHNVNKYGYQWLDSAQAQLPIPSFFKPNEYLDAL